jgi:hypothetical protein
VVLAVTGFLVLVSTGSALNWLRYVRDRQPVQARVTDVQARQIEESGGPTYVYRLTDTATGRDMGWAVGEYNTDRGPSQRRSGDLVEAYSVGDGTVLAEHARSGRPLRGEPDHDGDAEDRQDAAPVPGPDLTAWGPPSIRLSQ